MPQFYACKTCCIIKRKMKKCSECKIVRYCSIKCQSNDWSFHKEKCCYYREQQNHNFLIHYDSDTDISEIEIID